MVPMEPPTNTEQAPGSGHHADEATPAQTASPATPGEAVPPSVRRVLDRPPSERYAADKAAATSAASGAPTGSLARAAVFAILTAAVGAAVLVEVASPMALSEPLVLVAVVLGAATGLGTRRGGGSSVPVRQRRAIAVTVALVAVAAAEFIVWRLALSEGGVLGFADYQLEVFGPVAVLQPLAAGIAAWATA
jgi:hypothetical protein